MAGPPMAVVNACTRDGQGGSPTAVVIDDATLTDDDRHATAHRAGTSHTAFIDTSTADTPTVRFFTSAGELTNCGHGTIAAQAVLLHRSGATEHHGRQRTAGRTFATTAIRRRDGVEVWFDQGVIALADHADATGGGIIAALGLQRADIAAGVRVASPAATTSRPRPGSPDTAVHAARLRSADNRVSRLGYLGCFTYALSPTAGTAAARMFAPHPAGMRSRCIGANE
jgi:trans-2,3-dihydro-3-hydroxyanthranilate isomerase